MDRKVAGHEFHAAAHHSAADHDGPHGGRHHGPADHHADGNDAQVNTLYIEPVFNRVGELGPGEVVFGFYEPQLINPATGEQFGAANDPGEIDTYPAGFPADLVNITSLRFDNNTDYVITGFTLRIVGTALEPEQYNFTVTRDPHVQAFFADVNRDGHVGLSDIFHRIEVSDHGRTITFSDGEIPIGGRFTDFQFSATTTGEPMKAAIDASFSGEVPLAAEDWAAEAWAADPASDYL